MPNSAATTPAHIERPHNEDLFQSNNSIATIFSLEEWFTEPVSLSHIGWHACTPEYCCGPGIRDLYLIHYVQSGQGYLEADHTVYTLKEGQSFLIFPDEITTYRSDKDNPWTYVFFALRGEFAMNLLEMAGFRRDRRVLTVNNKEIPDIIYRAVEQLYESRSPYLLGLSTLTQLLHLYSQQKTLSDGIEHKQNRYAAKAKDYIDFNFSAKISLDSIAASLAICRNHLYRTFKAEYGISPNAYLVQKRLNFATKLLKESLLSTEHIAELSGFSAYSAFYRLFKLHFDCSPNEYRQRHAETK